MVFLRVIIVDKHVSVFLFVNHVRRGDIGVLRALTTIEVIVQAVLMTDERQQVFVGHHRVVSGVIESDAV